MSSMQLKNFSCQIAVIGSGLPGSIMALILAKLGFDVVVIDKATHPRFAIGESSTPMADAYLVRIASDFGIPELLPLSTYSGTRKAYPDLDVGIKRGFSYFWHEQNRKFEFEKQHSNELVVAASPNDEVADSNWMRSDVDHKIVQWFNNYGVQFLDNCQIHSISHSTPGFRFSLEKDSREFTLGADYFVDASGGSAVGVRAMGGRSRLREMWTDTSALFAHFEGLQRWNEFVPQQLRNDYPYRCDDAAVHQLIQNGWMWQLRFQSGVTSCGIVQRNNADSLFTLLSKLGEKATGPESLRVFHQITKSYPSLGEQFANAHVVSPKPGVFFRQRLQHWYDGGAGQNWCALPNTIGFVDPLHSKGIAHALSGVYRLGHLFRNEGMDPGQNLNQKVEKLADDFQLEIQFLDRLIALCYLSLESFDLFRLATLWYFAAATNFERCVCGQAGFNQSFLLSDDDEFRKALFDFADQLKLSMDETSKKTRSMDSLARKYLDSYDLIGLFDPPIPNMYGNTSAPRDVKTV